MLGPEFTVLGIPVASSTATIGFNIPPTATTVRVFASGPALLCSAASTPTIPRPGATGSPGPPARCIFNYGVTIILMIAGAA